MCASAREFGVGVPVTVTPLVHNRGMQLEPPRTLSPSKVAAFTDCALAFRFKSFGGSGP